MIDHRFSPVVMIAALLLCLSVPGISFAQAAPKEIDKSIARRDSAGTLWYEASRLGLEGQGWKDAAGPYQRFPSRAKAIVREEVWSLSRHTAGLCLRFRTDADSILAAWDGGVGMNHFAASGVSGLDLYVLTDGAMEIPGGGAAGTGPHRASAGRKPQR